MSLLWIILIFAATVVGLGLLAVLFWLVYAAYLSRVERRLARRKGLYRDLIAGLATRERELLEPELHQLQTLRDFDALEALLEEQARSDSARPPWLLDIYDRLGLVDKYAIRLRSARKWRERAFAAELLGRIGNAKAVPALLETVQATRSEDADVREIALRALARIADPRAVEALVQALKAAEVWLAPRIADILARHGDAVVDPMIAFLTEAERHPARAWAANILGELKAPRAFPVLINSLKDQDDEVRAKAAGALGRLGDRRAVTYLLDHLLSDPAPFVRARIAGALGQFPGTEVIERLVRALGDPAWWVRMRSVEALEQIGPTAESPLILALDDPDPEIRIRAAVALERLGVPGRLVTQIEQGEATSETQELLVKFGIAGARELLAEHLHHGSPAVREAMIGAIRDAERRDLAHELIERVMHDGEPQVRALALDTLHALGVEDAVPAALGALSDVNERVRAAATSLLGELGGSELAGVLIPRTNDLDPTVRAAAARALGLVQARGAEGDFKRLLGDPDARVRAAAAEGAAEAEWRGATPHLIELLRDPAEASRLAAATALGEVGDASAVAPLVKAFSDASPVLADAITRSVARLDRDALGQIVDLLLTREDATSRVRVVQTLGGLKAPYPTRLLEQLFRDSDPTVRAATAEVLGRVHEPQVAALLEQGLDDPDEIVRARAVDALVRLDSSAIAPRLLRALREDPSAVVRERTALAAGIFRIPGAEVELLRLCGSAQPVAVRAAAALALGAFDQESIVARVVEMADEDALREMLRDRLKHDAEFRLLGLRLRDARHVELRALGSASREQMEQTLADGMRGTLSADQRVRLVAGLRAFQGERSREALLSVVRSDPSPEVRATALIAVGGMLDAAELQLSATRALSDPNKVVRNAAVSLFARIAPTRGLPGLMRMLRSEDDPIVLQAVAQQAEKSFPAFHAFATDQKISADETVLVARIARYMQHPDLAQLIATIGRNAGPPVRVAVAELWALRPDLVDQESLALFATDPAVTVRRAAVKAWGAARHYDRLSGMLGDPDPGVRQQLAFAFLAAPDGGALEPFFLDPDESVRAALFVVRVLRGEWQEPPDSAAISRAAAAAAMHQAIAVETLRDLARDEQDQARRLAAALALAVLGDDAAFTVMRSDPQWAIRDKVGRMLSGWRDPSDEARHSA